MALALLVAVIWGFAFVVTRIGPDSFSPAQLTALRFVVAAIPIVRLPRPAVARPAFVAIGIWGDLLRRYPATTVAPFSLLVPFVGALSAAAVFGESFGPLRLAGMALVLLGLVLVARPGGTPPGPGRRA